MKRSLLLAILMLTCSTGCGAVAPYLADRGHDVLDIVTLQVGGLGLGATGRVGPIQAGLFVECAPGVGLRGGRCLPGADYFSHGVMGAVMRNEDFAFQLVCVGSEQFGRSDTSSSVQDRRKDFFSATVGRVYIPFCQWVRDEKNPAYYTQIEVAGGALLSARVGVNPGELLDFLLGWFGVDIYADDIGSEKWRREYPEPEQPDCKAGTDRP
jgi:hypothetical protein